MAHGVTLVNRSQYVPLNQWVIYIYTKSSIALENYGCSGICDGLTGKGKGLCIAYCVAKVQEEYMNMHYIL